MPVDGWLLQVIRGLRCSPTDGTGDMGSAVCPPTLIERSIRSEATTAAA